MERRGGTSSNAMGGRFNQDAVAFDQAEVQSKKLMFTLDEGVASMVPKDFQVQYE